MWDRLVGQGLDLRCPTLSFGDHAAHGLELTEAEQAVVGLEDPLTLGFGMTVVPRLSVSTDDVAVTEAGIGDGRADELGALGRTWSSATP